MMAVPGWAAAMALSRSSAPWAGTAASGKHRFVDQPAMATPSKAGLVLQLSWA